MPTMPNDPPRADARPSGAFEAAALERRLRAAPDDLLATQELAGLLFRTGRTAEAEAYARNAVRLAPENARSHTLMALVLADTHRPQAAEFHHRRALALAPPDAATVANLAWSLTQQGRLDEARRTYRRAAVLHPSIAQTWHGWAQTEDAARDLPAAQRLLDRARRLDPDHRGADTFAAALLARRGDPEQALAVLDTAAKRGADPDALLEKGRILDQMGRHDEAFAAFAAGKALLRRAGHRYAEEEAVDLIARLAAFFVAPRLRLMPRPDKPAAGPQPVFIAGAPRSGTTLVEQILSCHPAVAAGDELPALGAVVRALPQTLGSPLGYPEALSELWMGDRRDGLERLRDAYLRDARKLVPVKPGHTLFTDKMPFNETHLGLIALMFPAAPVVHVLRHPLDVVLSMMGTNLTHGFHCANDVETAARHVLRVFDLVEHYRREMPLRYLPLRYEDLVREPEPAVRRLLGFLGLGFDRRCLRFEENRRYARTPSHALVAEKLYSRSIDRHRAYRTHLKPVIPILEPVIHGLGYSL
ncbi:tetratricopeptide repeat-containing sulfotransferase family protein [Azospirillum rugosum]|uniref:Flp pilus assembly protein TadD n=1 Tax=Azospirillum rugosum TaxID=416170 RepID=A0ABS4SM65_9PROT|nr:sulfotransferase [Azospirillum rugosum]MBP2293329.1 Flp pilus assembly protein TadD [Azospirillum rugosum]